MEVPGFEALFECRCLCANVPSVYSSLPLLQQLAVGATFREEPRWNSRIPAPSITTISYHILWSQNADRRGGDTNLSPAPQTKIKIHKLVHSDLRVIPLGDFSFWKGLVIVAFEITDHVSRSELRYGSKHLLYVTGKLCRAVIC